MRTRTVAGGVLENFSTPYLSSDEWVEPFVRFRLGAEEFSRFALRARKSRRLWAMDSERRQSLVR